MHEWPPRVLVSRSASWQEPSSLTLPVTCTHKWDSTQAVDEWPGPSAWLVSRLESLVHLKRCLAGVPWTVPISCLQSIQHAAGACNRFLQVTPSGRILENAGFLASWRVHLAPLLCRGQGAGVSQQPCPWLTKQKNQKKNLDALPMPVRPLFPHHIHSLISVHM